MKKQCFYILAFLCFICPNLQAQEDAPRENSILLYSNFNFLTFVDVQDPFLENENLGFGFRNFSVAFFKSKENVKRSYWEADFSFATQTREGDIQNFNFDPLSSIVMTTVEPVETKSNYYGLRFEFGRWFKVVRDEKLKFGWAYSFRSFVFTDKLTPKSSIGFEQEKFKSVVTFCLVPRMRYELNNRFYLDLNYSLDLFYGGVDFQTINDPILTARQQRQGGFDLGLLGAGILRLGAGCKF